MADLADEHRSLLKFLYAAPLALVQAGLDGEIELMSPVAAQLLLPLTPQRRLGNVFDVLGGAAPDLRQLCSDFPHASGAICEALRLDVAAGEEQGRPRLVLSVSIVKLSSSTLILMLADITAQALQSQRDTEERLATKRRLAELTSDLEHALAVVAVSIAREDLVTGHVQSTSRLRRSLGLEEPAETLTIARWLQQVHPEDRAMFNEDRERAALGLLATFRDFRFLRPDGSVGYMAGRRYLEPDGDGHPSLVTFAIDVTEQRSTERERLALAEHLSLATTAANVGTFEFNAASGTVVWNAQTYALHGRPERVGDDARQIAREALSAGELARVAEWKRGMLEGWSADSIEFEVTWPDDQVHWLAARGRLRTDDAGHAVSLIGVVWEVTGRRRSEEAARAQRVAEQASRAKTEFLARISHELRTPLNAVIGFSELLQLNRETPLSPHQLVQVKHINDAGQHLLHLISDLLDVSRIELGKLDVRRTELSIDALARDAIHQVEPLATRNRVRIVVQTPNVRAAALADPTRVMQVLLNLLSNAVKYNREGGEVKVRWERAGHEWLVGVADTGIGMTQEQLQALFQPFNRLGRGNSNVQGVGIGLVVSRQLIEAMGGSLAVSSVPGVGSEFSVRLPAFDPA